MNKIEIFPGDGTETIIANCPKEFARDFGQAALNRRIGFGYYPDREADVDQFEFPPGTLETVKELWIEVGGRLDSEAIERIEG